MPQAYFETNIPNNCSAKIFALNDSRSNFANCIQQSYVGQASWNDSKRYFKLVAPVCEKCNSDTYVSEVLKNSIKRHWKFYLFERSEL